MFFASYMGFGAHLDPKITTGQKLYAQKVRQWVQSNIRPIANAGYNQEKTENLWRYFNDVVREEKTKHQKPLAAVISPVIRELISAGADPKVVDDKNHSNALHFAAEAGDADLIEFLVIHHNLDINEANKAYFTPLSYAAVNGHVKAIDKIIELKADIERRGNGAMTALMVAAACAQIESIDALIGHGANTETKDDSGWTALVYAGCFKQTESIFALVERGASLRIKSSLGKKIIKIAEGKAKRLLLKYCSKRKLLACERFLHSRIRLCAHFSDEEIAPLLSTYKDEQLLPMIKAVDEFGHQALDIAFATRNAKIVSLLLASGANPLSCRYHGPRLAYHIPEWRLPDATLNNPHDSLYKQLYSSYLKYYADIFDNIQTFQCIPNDIRYNIISFVLGLPLPKI